MFLAFITLNDTNFQVLKILKTLPKITIKQALSTLYEFFIIFFLTYEPFFAWFILGIGQTREMETEMK